MKVKQGFFRFFLFISLGIGVGGCAQKAPRLPVQLGNGQNDTPIVLVDTYRMAVSDQLQIIVWKNPELSLSEPVRPDGRISVPLVGDVVAVGLTPEELALVIKQALSNYIKNPNVTVVLTSLPAQEYVSRIRVIGSVGSNVSLTYIQGMTVLDAVLEAGSLGTYADGNRTKLHRRFEGGAETYDIRLDDIMEDGDMTTNVILLPGDTITVPERGF